MSVSFSNFRESKETTALETTLHSVSEFRSRDENNNLVPVLPGQEKSLIRFKDAEGKIRSSVVFNNVFHASLPIKVGLSPIPVRIEAVENVGKDGVVYQNVVAVVYNSSDLHTNDIQLMSRVGFKLS